MIGRLTGSLLVKKPPLLLIEVAGVGYEVQAPLSTIAKLPSLNQTVVLMTHHYVREDAQILYGFSTEQERALFRSLIKISGVGPKMALGILSGMTVQSFVQCVERRDASPLTRLSGVGKKTAERLIVEMAGKLKTSFEDDLELKEILWQPVIVDDVESPAENNTGNKSDKSSLGNSAKNSISYLKQNLEKDAVAALIALGYKPQEASYAVNSINLDEYEEIETLTSEELIRQVLRALGKKSSQNQKELKTIHRVTSTEEEKA